MQEIPVNLNGLEKEDVFSVASALLYSLRNTPKYSTISELFYILDYDNFIKLIKYYGGETVRIPSISEISETLRLLVLYQCRVVEEMSWEESLKKAGIDEENSMTYRAKLDYVRRLLDKLEIGGRHYD